MHAMPPDPPARSSRNRSKEFLLEEQKQRRLEIEKMLARMETDQRLGLIFTGALWSWAAVNRSAVQGAALYVMLIIPPLLTAFFFWRWRALLGCIRVVAEYTTQLECHFDVPEDLGWERWLAKENEARRPRGTLRQVYKAFWVAMLIFNVMISIVLSLSVPSTRPTNPAQPSAAEVDG